MPESYDAIIIGTGQSGPSLAGRLTGAGQRVAVVERGRFGGTCVNYGCTPTKAMVASARAAHLARRGADYGVDVGGPVRVDLGRVQDRKDAIVKASTEGVENWLRGMDGAEVVTGHARLTGADTVDVDGRALRAGQIFLNVGTRARTGGIDGLDAVGYLTNTDMLTLRELPGHLLIIGGSYIGLEFGQMFRRFGARVTVIERGERIVGREDPRVSEALAEVLRGEGIDIRTGAECIGLEAHPDGVQARLVCDGDETVVGSHVLLAAGRTPNTDDLGLDAAGVRTDRRGYVEVDDRCRTNVDGIWALGDCNGRGAFTHTSYNDFEIVAANVLDDEPRALSDRHACYALFTDPPLARVGMNDAAARESGRPVEVAELPMSGVGRAREMGETAGFLRVLVDGETKRILGATLLGVGVDEAVHALIDVMYADAPYTRISRAMHIHPTVSELLPTALQSLRPLD